MKSEKPNSEDGHTSENMRSQSAHMWMMIVCCALPLVAILAIGAFGVNAPSLKTLLLLICPIAMGVMVFSMMRDQYAARNKHIRGQSDQSTSKPTGPLQDQSANTGPSIDTPPQELDRQKHPATFKA